MGNNSFDEGLRQLLADAERRNAADESLMSDVAKIFARFHRNAEENSAGMRSALTNAIAGAVKGVIPPVSPTTNGSGHGNGYAGGGGDPRVAIENMRRQGAN